MEFIDKKAKKGITIINISAGSISSAILIILWKILELVIKGEIKMLTLKTIVIAALPNIVIFIIVFTIIYLIFDRFMKRIYDKKISDKTKELEEMKRNYDKEISERAKKLAEKMIEPNEQILKLKQDFEEPIKILRELFSNVSYSLYKVFTDIGRDLEGYINSIVVLVNYFLTFNELFKCSNDLEDLRDRLLFFIKNLEIVSEGLGKQRENWRKDYNEEEMNNLIREYARFVDKLKSFYEKMSWEKPRLHYLDRLLFKNNS